MQPIFDPFLTFLRQAAAAQSSGDARARSLWLEAAAHLHPTDRASIDRMMVDLLQQQQIAQAISLVETIAQLEPHDAAASVRLGYALQSANRHRDALAPYRHALAIDPASPRLRTNLAIALNRTGGDPEEERQLLEAAVAADPADFSAWINLMGARRACFDVEGSLAAAMRAVELDPRSALAHGNLAQALKESQHWDDALAHAKQACELAPGNASLHEWRSFDDTAACISELDLVISVCTSTAHLAGALGRRTWVLLDVNPYWTWMTDGRDSPWYPTATLYRQRQFAQWQPVMDEVASDLRALVRRRA
ncbi:tetratricopeptide repeat protein [Paraburkholderia diazotrophica]|uniref:Tetratricopeptide repeat-containing protein n=1 Tax=Paraburkholderia diazotrophica TaxID=667676 RepID=A0A1H6ZYU6_9BURK|nr:tetratricopeptide repeat protein [Paraburkholderia diazotrophica]SEJ58388.1 Tetratricopeptide repeat-containing protein [Paraburkholderia diazotrophica]